MISTISIVVMISTNAIFSTNAVFSTNAIFAIDFFSIHFFFSRFTSQFTSQSMIVSNFQRRSKSKRRNSNSIDDETFDEIIINFFT